MSLESLRISVLGLTCVTHTGTAVARQLEAERLSKARDSTVGLFTTYDRDGRPLIEGALSTKQPAQTPDPVTKPTVDPIEPESSDSVRASPLAVEQNVPRTEDRPSSGAYFSPKAALRVDESRHNRRDAVPPPPIRTAQTYTTVPETLAVSHETKRSSEESKDPPGCCSGCVVG